jgi:4-methoxybenzoate monooxygenase (O-demethylating)
MPPSAALQETLGPPPSLDIDPFASEWLKVPYAFHKVLRDAAPIVFVPKYNCYATGRYQEVRLAFSDWNRFSSAAGTGLGHIGRGEAWRPPGPIVESDPPDHTALRSTLTRVLSPLVVRSWREQFTREAERLVGELVQRDEFDAVRDLVEPYVLKVFPDALGIEIAGRENLLAIGELTGNALGPPNQLFLDSMQAVEPILPWFNSKFERAAMLPGGFGEKIWLLSDTGEIAVDKVVPLLRTFLRGGMDTVISGISSALWLLASNPDQWRLLRADPALIRVVFEEAIRLETPAQALFRTTKGAVEFAGYRLESDVKVLCSLGAANRDPNKWPNADTFDLKRTTIGQLALGVGVHVCLGQMIARLEAEAILTSLLAHVDQIELTQQPVHRLNNTARRLETLALRLKPI